MAREIQRLREGLRALGKGARAWVKAWAKRAAAGGGKARAAMLRDAAWAAAPPGVDPAEGWKVAPKAPRAPTVAAEQWRGERVQEGEREGGARA